MPTHQELFYETAVRELVDCQTSQAMWGKAFSLAVGDEQTAKALYIKFRVEQLEREHQQYVGELLRVWRAEIIGGKSFVCPYCKSSTTANCSIFNRYTCKSCGVELMLGPDPIKAKLLESAAGKSNNPMAVTGFILGLASVILYTVGIVPILAVLFSGIGLSTFKAETQKNMWMAGAGLALGVVYTIMMLNQYGHLK